MLSGANKVVIRGSGVVGAKRIVKEASVPCWEDMIAHLRAFRMEVGVGGMAECTRCWMSKRGSRDRSLLQSGNRP